MFLKDMSDGSASRSTMAPAEVLADRFIFGHRLVTLSHPLVSEWGTAGWNLLEAFVPGCSVFIAACSIWQTRTGHSLVTVTYRASNEAGCAASHF
jgi:hypothetical protein